jgi:hypothetical protein
MKQATFLAALGLAVVVCPLPDSFRATAQASTQQGTALVSPGMEAPAKLPDLVVKQVWLDEACQIRYRIENAGSGGISDRPHAQGAVRVSVGGGHKDFYFTRGTSTGQPAVDAGGVLKKPRGSVDYGTGITLDEAESVIVFVDQGRKIPESDEGNNQTMLRLNPQCRAQAQAPPQSVAPVAARGEGSKDQGRPTDLQAVKARAIENARLLGAQRKAALAQKREQELRALNARALARIQSLKASPRPARPGPGSGPLEILTSPTQVSATTSRATSPVRLESVTPQPVTPGQTLTILGEGLGTARGRVSLNVERIWVSLPVDTWRDTHVVVTVPAGLADLVGAREKDARMELHRADSGAGTMTVRLAPDVARLTPTITSLSTTKVRPGEMFFVEGRNFFSREGRVRFEHVSSSGASLGTTLDGIVDLWDDTVVAVHLRADLEGFTWDASFAVEIENGEGLRSNRLTVLLDPNVDTEVLVDTKELDVAGSNNVCGPSEKHPQTRGFMTFEGRHLQNGWRLATSNLYAYVSSRESPSGTCVYALRPPREHTTFPETGIYITNPSGSCWCHCDHVIEIEGPRGFHYE